MNIYKRNKIILNFIIAFALTSVLSPVSVIAEERADGRDLLMIREENDRLESRLSGMEAGKDYIEDEAFADASTLEEAEEIAETYGAELLEYEEGIAVLKLPADIKTVLSEAEKSVSVSAVLKPQLILEDYTLETTSLSDYNDPELGSQWFHEKINDVNAWNISTGKGAVVAVLDTGTQASNDDLKRITDITCTGDMSSGTDTNGHGTHVAGIIAAERNNGSYGCGVAPDADIYSIRITEDGSITLSDAVEGIRKAISKKVDVINMSFGATGDYKDDFQDYIDEAWKAGIVVVAAAGNKGVSNRTYPAACDHVIAVAATTKDGKLADYSNYGSWVDISAPGGSSGEGNAIYSTYISDGGFKGLIGTSQASPMVAAAAALIYSADSSLKKSHSSSAADEVSARILGSSDGMTYSCGGHSVTGGLDIYSAIGGYKFREPSGYLTTSGNQYIGAGRAMKLRIAYGSGTVPADAKKAKNVKWEVSDTSLFSIKNGRLKCLKTAEAGASANVIATYKGVTVSACFIVTKPAFKYGYLSNGKVENTLRSGISANIGETVSVNDICSLTGQNIRVWTDDPAGSGSENSVSADMIGYSIKISNKKKITVTGCDDRGNPVAFIPNKAGNYTVTYTLTDGSGRKFKVRIRVS